MSEIASTTLDSPEFRRQPVATKRRRARPILRWLRVAARVLLVLAPMAALAYWMLTSPVWSLQAFSVSGTQRMAPSAIEISLKRLRGENLLRLSLPSLQESLGSLPWVRSVAIRKRLPNRLSVRVIERQPSAVWRSGEGRFLIDEGGAVIAAVPDGSALAWLEVRTPASTAEASDQHRDHRLGRREAIEISARLEQLLDPAIGRVSVVTSLGQGDYQVEFEGLEFPLVVDKDIEEQKLEWLARLLPQLVTRYGPLSSIDLRFERRVVLQPAIGSGEAGPKVG